MCRLMVVQDEHTPSLIHRTKNYVQLLDLSMELEDAPDWDSAMAQLCSGTRVDILMIPDSANSTLLAEHARKVQPWLKCLLIHDSSSLPKPRSSADLYVPQSWGIRHFYQAISVLSPATADTARLPNQQSNDPSSVLSRILSVLHIIETEYRSDISLEYIAQRIYISPCYLSTLFSRFMGVSLLSYLNDFRMQKAVELLLESDLKVTDICQEVGYRNLPYFCTCFKSRFEMTPAQYRRQYAKIPAAG